MRNALREESRRNRGLEEKITVAELQRRVNKVGIIKTPNHPM
jgi:hypothetical protein